MKLAIDITGATERHCKQPQGQCSYLENPFGPGGYSCAIFRERTNWFTFLELKTDKNGLPLRCRKCRAQTMEE